MILLLNQDIHQDEYPSLDRGLSSHKGGDSVQRLHPIPAKPFPANKWAVEFVERLEKEKRKLFPKVITSWRKIQTSWLDFYLTIEHINQRLRITLLCYCTQPKLQSQLPPLLQRQSFSDHRASTPQSLARSTSHKLPHTISGHNFVSAQHQLPLPCPINIGLYKASLGRCYSVLSRSPLVEWELAAPATEWPFWFTFLYFLFCKRTSAAKMYNWIQFLSTYWTSL